MSWLNKTLSSSLGRKLLMALSGLFLILFLTGHVIGNLQLFYNDGGQSFNMYAKFMTTNPVVKVLSYLTYFSVLLHTLYAIMLTKYNKAARGRDAYAVANTNTTVSARNMGILGSLILVFLVVHMTQFWARMHGFWGQMPMAEYEGVMYKDLYAIVVEAYANPLWVIAYVVSMGVLSYHLLHGFQSAFQTVGFNNQKYTPVVKSVGNAFAVAVPLLFAAMPIYLFLFK